jgi:hypothetical protein
MPPISAAAVAAIKAKAMAKKQASMRRKSTSETSLLFDKIPDSKEVEGEYDLLILSNGYFLINQFIFKILTR